jgi:predicted RNA-binding protein with PUA-like domain
LLALTPVTLETCKNTASLADMALVKSPRLSVQPVSLTEWDIICALGEIV